MRGTGNEKHLYETDVVVCSLNYCFSPLIRHLSALSRQMCRKGCWFSSSFFSSFSSFSSFFLSSFSFYILVWLVNVSHLFVFSCNLQLEQQQQHQSHSSSSWIVQYLIRIVGVKKSHCDWRVHFNIVNLISKAFNVEHWAQSLSKQFKPACGRLERFMKNAFEQTQYLRKASTYPIKRNMKVLC